MKKITFLLLLLSSFAYSQDKPTGTTQDEYNYMTKGYKIQISSGLDMKKGYHVQDITKVDSKFYTFDFKNLLRVDSGQTAGTILVATSKVWGNVYYMAIPVDNSSLLADFNTKLEAWDEDMTTAYASASTGLLSVLLDVYHSTRFKNTK